MCFSRENVATGEVDGGWEGDEVLPALRVPIRRGRGLKTGRELQGHFAYYYSTNEGRLDWQDRMVAKNRGKLFIFFFWACSTSGF